MKKYFPILHNINLPNMVTTLGLIFGVMACYYLFEGKLRESLVCLFFASLMDLIDGFFAVKLNQRTLFGKYADSLVDFFICCIIPMLMAFVFLDGNFLLFLCLGFYCVCGMWRLANFNTITEKQTHFTGLPVPGAMLFVTITIWFAHQYGSPVWVCMLVFFKTGLLMVSPLKLKKYGIGQKALWLVWLLFFSSIILHF